MTMCRHREYDGRVSWSRVVGWDVADLLHFPQESQLKSQATDFIYIWNRFTFTPTWIVKYSTPLRFFLLSLNVRLMGYAVMSMNFKYVRLLLRRFGQRITFIPPQGILHETFQYKLCAVAVDVIRREICNWWRLDWNMNQN